MNHACFIARLALCLLLAAKAAHAAPAATVAAPGLNVTVSAVEPNVFHLIATPPGNSAPPVSLVEDPLEVRVYPGTDAAFTLYKDDTYAYQRGISSRIPMLWNDQTRILTVGVRTGAFPGMLTTRHLNVVLPDRSHKSVTYAGRAV